MWRSKKYMSGAPHRHILCVLCTVYFLNFGGSMDSLNFEIIVPYVILPSGKYCFLFNNGSCCYCSSSSFLVYLKQLKYLGYIPHYYGTLKIR